MAMKGKAAKGSLKAAKAMPGKRSAARGAAKLGASAAKRNAYMQAILHDDRVHERVRTGIGSARAAYGRASRRGKGADALFSDRRARRDLGRALAAFQEAAVVMRGARLRRRRSLGLRTIVAVVALGGAVALVVDEGLREKVIGLVSGSSTGSGSAAAANTTTSPTPR